MYYEIKFRVPTSSQDIRIGNTDQSTLGEATSDFNAEKGCAGQEVCQAGTCGVGTCVDQWNSYSCDCPAGGLIYTIFTLNLFQGHFQSCLFHIYLYYHTSD